MCGRFVLLADLRTIAESFDIREVSCAYRPGNDISPGRQVLAVIRKDRQNSLVSYRWGLIPSWAKDPSIGRRMFNARAETLTEKPSFRDAFDRRRCLIVADGFYEWQKQGKTKKRFCFRLRSGKSFGMAGLHESWTSPDRQTIHTCTVITTASNDLIRPIHDRMPVMVPKDLETAWIDPENRNRTALLSLLKPYPAEDMQLEATIAVEKERIPERR
jgi:putative SOS response-associated peptidase YedK